MILDKNIKFILEILQKNGQGYIVGGFIRDTFLGLNPKDCDFLTDIEYDKLLKIFKEYSPKEIGKAFGIIQIKIDKETYEIVKMRQDKGIPENRKEQEIEFTKNIYEDLKRRDFTINAIAYDGEKFYYGDPSSKNDLEKKYLRFVGDCSQRVEEDPLRIMRYFRFLATKDLMYDDITIKKLETSKSLLKKLSVERIREELNKIILGKNSFKILKLMSENKILEEIFPEIEIKNNLLLKNLEKLDEDLIIRLAVLFYKTKDVKSILYKFRYDNKSVERVSKLIDLLNIDVEEKYDIFLKKKLNLLGTEDIEKYIKILKINKNLFKNIDLEKMEENYFYILENNLPYSIKDLKISGKDLIQLGFNGKEIGEILNLLLERVIKSPQANTKEKLIELIKKSNI